MIKFTLVKWDATGWYCSNRECDHLPEHTYQILNSYFLKPGTTCLSIAMNNNAYELYCRGCIDKLYIELKPILDSKLWAFK